MNTTRLENSEELGVDLVLNGKDMRKIMVLRKTLEGGC
jgi:hypothetical protein